MRPPAVVRNKCVDDVTDEEAEQASFPSQPFAATVGACGLICGAIEQKYIYHNTDSTYPF